MDKLNQSAWPSAQQVLDSEAFLSGLDQQQEMADLKRFFQSAISALGFCSFDAYSIRVDTLDQPKQKGNFCVASYPMEYIRQYVLKGFAQQCPGLRKAGAARLPFDYLDFLNQEPKSPSVAWQRALFGLSNVHHAWLVPLNSTNLLSGVTVYMQGNGEQDRARFYAQRDTIHVWATYFFEALLTYDPSALMADWLSDNPSGFDALSKREVDCLQFCASGKTNREIAALMKISENTVRFHMKNIFRKLNVNNRAHAISKVGALMTALSA